MPRSEVWPLAQDPDDVAFVFVIRTEIGADRFRDYLVLHLCDGPEREAVNGSTPGLS